MGIDRKRYGVVYTPSNIVELILDNTLPFQPDSLYQAKICDPACGNGAFLTAVARRVLDRLPRAEALSVLRNLTGYDIDRYAIEECVYNLDSVLYERYPKEIISWNVKERNALNKHEFNKDLGVFTHVVGNPPYVRVQHLEQTGRDIIKNNWKVVRGATDLYLLFIELGLELLRDKGVLGYITPSSWMRTDSGSLLRELLVNNHQVSRIIDFADHQIFDEATTYTAITIVRKNVASIDIPVDVYDGSSFHFAGFISLDKSHPNTAWSWATSADRDRMQRLVQRGPKLSDVADIHVGLQTLADKVFILSVDDAGYYAINNSDYIPCQTENGILWLESWILRRIVKASVLKNGIDPINRVVIFPYDINGKLLAEEKIATSAPNVYAWLIYNKSKLLNRDKNAIDHWQWYAFGRQVSIVSGFGDKIITSIMNQYPNFQRCADTNTTFYSGYCIKPKYNVDMSALLDALNSDDMDFFIRRVSQPYRGGWMSYAKTFIKDFPLPSEFRPVSQLRLL